MKLFYNPAFTGGAYVDFTKSPVLFDAKLVNMEANIENKIKLAGGTTIEQLDEEEASLKN